MKLTEQSLNNPSAVAIVATVIMLLGIISILNMPAQLLPQVNKPVLTVVNSWPGASPREIESEITVPIEEVLRGTPGMTKMFAYNMSNVSYLQLEFALETDMTRALIEVISRLNRLRPLPANAQKPQVQSGEWGDANDQLIEYYIEQLPGFDDQVQENRRFIRDVIVPELQSLYGVSSIDLGDAAGDGDQLQIIIDPFKAADYGIDIAKLPQRVGRSIDISSGTIDVGRRTFTLRIEGRYDPLEFKDLILEWRNGLPVKLGDIARIEVGPGKRNRFIYHNGQPATRIGIARTNDANVLEALAGVKAKMKEYNEGIFKARGLKADYSFDPAVYINRSINLLSGNLIAGIILAIGVLWLFLRQWRATFLIALAIPVSLLTTFVILSLAGRSLNVISLAGLAFATGMVLDAAIVVLENIVRLREKGIRPLHASHDGAVQVWGALLASTATTVAIFIPIMFLKDVEGQMFADLALTIAIGVSVSLLVAVTILPTAARFWMREMPAEPKGRTIWDSLSDKVIHLTDTSMKRITWIASLSVVSVVLSVSLWPESNYLPPVKRDTVDTFLFFPPGTNIETADREIAQVIDARLQPHLTGNAEPRIRDYFLWSFPGGSGGWLAINPLDDGNLDELMAQVQSDVISGLPDTFGFTQRRSLFGGFESESSVEMRISASDINAIKPAVAVAIQTVMAKVQGSSANPQPDPNAETSELRFTPNDTRLAEVGWTRQDLTNVVLELGQGSWLGEYFSGSERLDVYLRTEAFTTPEQIASLSVVTPLGETVPLGDLAEIDIAPSPPMIVRINGKRSYSVIVNPPEGMSLEGLITTLKTEVEPAIREVLPIDGSIAYAGNAEDLARAIGTLGMNFIVAFLLLILIMAGLFKSLMDAVLVVISIPLAAVGGVLALNIMNLIKFQPLDLLGMIGFIILLGLVVNNAILLVAQTRAAEREEGLPVTEAVHQALRLRLRPIFMSTLTSLFGMLPLLLVPGAGSEIYRGMAAAIVGGMSVSTLFTLILLPSLLQMTGRKTARMPMASDTAVAQPAE